MMGEMQEFKAGTECAAWFDNRFSNQIVQDVRDFVDAFGQLRAEVESIEKEKIDEETEQWYNNTPPGLAHAYEILAPEAAYPNTRLHIVVVVSTSDTYWRIGTYSTMVGSDGALPASWQQYQWQPRIQVGLPWPRTHQEGESEQVLPTPEKTTVDKATGFLSTFVNKVSEASDQFYGQVYDEMFPERGIGGPAHQQPQQQAFSYRSIGDKSSQGGNRLVSGKKARKEKTSRHIGDALQATKRRLGGNSSSSSTFSRPPGRGAKTSSAYTDEELVSLFKSTKFTPYPDWFSDLEIENKSGNVFDHVVRQMCVPVLRQVMGQKSPSEISRRRVWHYIEVYMTQEGYLKPSCTYRGGKYASRVSLDQDGYCTCTACNVNPHYGDDDDFFQGLAEQDQKTGRCKRQTFERAKKLNRRV